MRLPAQPHGRGQVACGIGISSVEHLVPTEPLTLISATRTAGNDLQPACRVLVVSSHVASWPRVCLRLHNAASLASLWLK